MDRIPIKTNPKLFDKAVLPMQKVLADILWLDYSFGICESLVDVVDGKKYTLDEAEDLIPVHPNCRCIVLPYIEEIDEMLANKTHFKHDFKQDKLNQYKTIKK